ncbi:plasmid pRiA4b ORF-3 family protein [uncultured Serinicoccus sp.]|uniref:plasmid pRiA4b ORF-3 family protein n=1 Tax=uncultured Serinicoccus sp. TaxID=735514 RepID=UPI0026244456|nr:plasmid pRiA4b ORF-3 family protein [uncultured Serinicoccus sp.]
MPQDLPEDLRRAVASMTPDELHQLLAGIAAASGVTAPGFGRPRVEPVVLPDPPEDDLLLTVRVDVDDVRPPVWRRLELRGDLQLDEVHEILQAAFGWLDGHLHRFWPGPAKRIWTGPFFTTELDEIEPEDEDEGMQPEDEVRLDQVLRQPGDRLFYTYDFGDDWTCTIKLEKVVTLDDDAEGEDAVCTAARMAGPLEDCGGPPGHQELVDAFRAGGLPALDPALRAWVPPGWDPFEEDVASVNERLRIAGMTQAELMKSLASGEDAVAWPSALEPLLDLALPDVLSELAELTRTARDASRYGDLTAADLAALARPYRYLVDLAGEDGIPLTHAGWMKPTVVEQIYRDLGFEDTWIGKGNREDQTAPVADLRARCQRVGLLRKYRGRLLRTRAAAALTDDADLVQHVAGRVGADKNDLVQAAMALFALVSAATGEAGYDHRVQVADLMTRCGLRTTSRGVDPHHALEWCRPVWRTLSDASGLKLLRGAPDQHSRRRVAGMARMMLWPQGVV